MDFSHKLKERIEYIEIEMKSLLYKEEGYQKTLFESMNYSFNAGGKRIRPILVMEAYKLCGGDSKDYVPFSTAIEMIHTYSLIHDDLPALDNDDLRRGKPTNHKVYGEAMAILAGDGLLNSAFEMMLKYSLSLKEPKLGLLASYEVSKASGVNGMIGGQVVDVESEGKKIELDKLEFIHRNKTAAMIVASMRAGAILAKCDDDTLQKITDYAESIGLCFQIVDDILDIEGDENLLGKNVGSDILNEKSTYPSLIGMQESKIKAKELVDRAKLSINDIKNNEFLLELAEYIYNRKM